MCYIIIYQHDDVIKWKLFSALLATCAGNSPIPGEFPTQRPVTRSFDVYFDLRPNKRLSKQMLGWWFETLSRPLWRHRNEDRDMDASGTRVLISILPIQMYDNDNGPNGISLGRSMMTPSNGNIFRVTGFLCGEFPGHRWIPCTKASDAELWCFLWFVTEQMVE